jgi:dihydrofolate reductase
LDCRDSEQRRRAPHGCHHTIAAGDLAEAITRLKQERSDGYLLAHGGARFARSLVETGLIDEYRLVVHPTVLDAGERIFLAPLSIEPMSTTVFSGGAVAHVFAAHPRSSLIGNRGADAVTMTATPTPSGPASLSETLKRV